MIKVALSGPHGTGKSTATSALVEWARQKWPHLKIALASETARRCPFEINENVTPEGQRWIYHAQILLELELSRTHDLVICDRSALDGLVYALRAREVSRGQAQWDWITCYLSMFMEDWLSSYDLIWLCRVDPHFPDIVNDGVRSTDGLFQKQIMVTFDSFDEYWTEGEPVEIWPGLEQAKLVLAGMVDVSFGQRF